MSWASTISRSITTPNQSSRDGRKVTGWIIHHNASMGGSYVLSLMQSGSKQVSANYQVMQDGEVVGVVPRELRSWSASNSAWDGASLTFEIANNSGAPGWTISEGAYLSVARTIAEDSVWAGIPINRTTVRGHREGSALGDGGSYATACPGGIDLDRLVRMANDIRSGGTSTTARKRGREMHLVKELNGTIWLQTANGRATINDPSHTHLFLRAFNAYPNAELFNGAELAIMNGYVLAASQVDDSGTQAVIAAISKINVDPAVVAAAIQAGLSKVTVSSTISAEDIAAIAKSSADAVTDDLYARLAS